MTEITSSSLATCHVNTSPLHFVSLPLPQVTLECGYKLATGESPAVTTLTVINDSDNKLQSGYLSCEHFSTSRRVLASSTSYTRVRIQTCNWRVVGSDNFDITLECGYKLATGESPAVTTLTVINDSDNKLQSGYLSCEHFSTSLRVVVSSIGYITFTISVTSTLVGKKYL
ncbi:hypothetical protein J6590_081332 [Homalodisca vitripennis]|nr:hypothetical protein J6590_081332 [Homalodisca vitripennis]